MTLSFFCEHAIVFNQKRLTYPISILILIIPLIAFIEIAHPMRVETCLFHHPGTTGREYV